MTRTFRITSLEMSCYSSAVWVLFCLCFRSIFRTFSPEIVFVIVLHFLRVFFPTIFGRVRALQMSFFSSAVWVLFCLCFRTIFRSFSPEMVFVIVLHFLRVFSDNFRESTRSSDVVFQFSGLGVILPMFSYYFSVILSRNGFCLSTTFLRGFFSDHFRESTCSSDVILLSSGVSALPPFPPPCVSFFLSLSSLCVRLSSLSHSLVSLFGRVGSTRGTYSEGPATGLKSSQVKSLVGNYDFSSCSRPICRDIPDPLQEAWGPSGLKCSGECPTECRRKSGCQKECPGECRGGPFGPERTEASCRGSGMSQPICALGSQIWL